MDMAGSVTQRIGPGLPSRARAHAGDPRPAPGRPACPQVRRDRDQPHGRTSLPRRAARLVRAMACRLLFLPSERELEIESGEMTLLEATRAVGLPIASACGQNGACARCGLEILEGASAIDAPSEREERIKERNRIDPKLRLACRVRPRGDMTVRAAYW